MGLAYWKTAFHTGLRWWNMTLVAIGTALISSAMAGELPEVRVSNVRRVFANGEHNAFTDLIRFKGRYYLTFRSCPDGHLVHPSSSIRVLASDDLQSWTPVHRFSVPLRDTRDPHFLCFRDRLFVLTGTWYCGQTSPDPSTYDLNLHLGYACDSQDGRSWSQPRMLEGTFGHYIWRAAMFKDTAYLCGRRKHHFDVRPRGEGPNVESAMLVSGDGLTWRTGPTFQSANGDETAFLFDPRGSLRAVGRRGRNPAEWIEGPAPWGNLKHADLGTYIGGPLLKYWGARLLVGGRRMAEQGPTTTLYWWHDGSLHRCADLPSGGDCSYPGFIPLSETRAVVSWYSSHETDAEGRTVTAIYLADLELVPPTPKVVRSKIAFRSTWDGTPQPAYLTVPEAIADQGAAGHVQRRLPMVVSLHSWSADLEQRQPDLEQLVAERGWVLLQPHFRGVNDRPAACGSPAAQQDILDAISWVIERYPVDPAAVFLTGVSGGGHMTMLMAGRYPERFRAASAWVGISDLASWHDRHADDRYGSMLRAVCGGPPGSSFVVDEQYRLRSPLHYLAGIGTLPLDLYTGIDDGHSGSVPVRQSLDAFNTIADSGGAERITEDETEQLSRRGGRLHAPRPGDTGFDDCLAREFFLRRYAGNSRITVFDGGHEGIAAETIAWFDSHLDALETAERLPAASNAGSSANSDSP
ncbi:MAG: hypothetical protein KatS3mg111_4158 [Pirellulaceae bacterium]|nr:MAG: hypothetical protein KatS3mg111_4158 [Pirellulaceae bacterium]